MRRKRDAHEAAAATPDETKKDKPTRILEKAVSGEAPMPDEEKGRPKDSGRMGA